MRRALSLSEKRPSEAEAAARARAFLEQHDAAAR
jgi:hypothetical protein